MGMPPAVPCVPVFGGVLVGEDTDRIDDLDKTLNELRKVIKSLSHRLGRMEERMDRSETQFKSRLDASEKAITQATIGQEELHEMIEAFEAKLAERIKLLSKTLDFRIMEERLRHGMDALKDQEKVADVSRRMKDIDSEIQQVRDAFKRELRQIEDKFLVVQARKDDAAFRGCEEKIAAIQGIKTRIEAIETRLADKTSDDRAQGHMERFEKDFASLQGVVTKLERDIQQIEESNRTRGQDAIPRPSQGFQVPANRALVVVSLPADAKLFLEGALTRGDSSLRAFITPELEAGATYSYTLKVEFHRDGRLETRTRQVYFRSGNEIRVNFGHGEAMPAAARNGN